MAGQDDVTVVADDGATMEVDEAMETAHTSSHPGLANSQGYCALRCYAGLSCTLLLLLQTSVGWLWGGEWHHEASRHSFLPSHCAVSLCPGYQTRAVFTIVCFQFNFSWKAFMDEFHILVNDKVLNFWLKMFDLGLAYTKAFTRSLLNDD